MKKQATQIVAGHRVKVAPHRGYHEVKEAIRGCITVTFIFDPNPEIPETVVVPLTAGIPVLKSSLGKVERLDRKAAKRGEPKRTQSHWTQGRLGMDAPEWSQS